MDIQAEKIELLKKLLESDNPKVIQSIKQIFKKEKPSDFWDELTPDQPKEIREASVEVEQGDTTDYEAFIFQTQINCLEEGKEFKLIKHLPRP